MFRLAKAAAGAAVVVGVLWPAAAFAVEPHGVEAHFVDESGVVVDSAATYNSVARVPNTGLYVVIVDDFSGMNSESWAKDTAEKSGLKQGQGLVAIATKTRDIGFYALDGYDGVTAAVLQQSLSDEVLAEFKNKNWDVGIQKLAQNVTSAMDGSTVEHGGSTPPIVPIAGGALAVGAGVFAVSRVKARNKKKMESANIEKLAQEASAALLDADDNLRSALAELEFAKAEFGVEATAKFTTALAGAQGQVHEAFMLQKLLGDDDPETPAEQREMNGKILELSKSVQGVLAEHQKAFSELRALARRVDEKLAELTQRSSEISSGLPLVAKKIEDLRRSYAPQMLVSFENIPHQVEGLLAASGESITTGTELAEKGEKNKAVPYAQLAEGAIGQASDLVASVDQAPGLIAGAKEAVAAAAASLTSDVADAERLGGGDQAISARAGEARKVLARVGADNDFLTLQRDLRTAEEALDLALTGVRAADDQRRRTQGRIESDMGTAKENIAQTDSLISTYRAAVGADARTLLARARTALAQATRETELEAKAEYARSAVEQSSSALAATRNDIRYNDADQRRGGGGGNDLLTGMIIGGILNGISSSGHRSGGSWGGGSWGGSFGGGSFGGGSFGGGGGGSLKF
ncbi:putative membrane protein YgcG [Arcanobacterium wilhelmae]|uniref:Membrane protein YgcG n=1 Tax=Arcanobacterium wilhelmae TaxID=1803177 RepID=A0ABT9NBR4_9ACTO|nr:TPM domain-containing protein [Arcanobacterium wilhelmae]MDP9801162.1 putative membrane protein YgcG [Arcanobacterium wilhelmae]